MQSINPSSSLGQPGQPDLKPHPQPIPVSSSRHALPSALASPSRLRSSSPRVHSPASSEIFERNVQEPVPISTLSGDSDAHIPSHVMTEDLIPPALEASAQAITSETLDPDDVEIVTSSVHQPAAVSVLEGSSSHADLTSLHPTLQHQRSTDSSELTHVNSSFQSGAPGASEDDGASNYGALDPNDVRRLSFISFADVVQAEHVQQHQQQQQQQQHAAAMSDPIGSRDSLPLTSHISSISSVAAGGAGEHGTTSPLRSPRSPGSSGLATPPLSGAATGSGSGSGSHVGNNTSDQSPVRGAPPHQHGELNIETMRQALRHTASGDLSGGRSAGMSPVSEKGRGEI